MRLRLRSPRRLGRTLLAAARRDNEEVAEYLEANTGEWEALAEATPPDAADILEELEEEDAAELISDLDAPGAAEVLEEIAPELAAELIEEVPIVDLAAALNEMSSESAADLIGEMDDDLADDLFAAMADDAEQRVRDLLVFPGDTAGGLMTTETASLPLELTTDEATERLRLLNDEFEDLSYVYVVDDNHRLEGVLSFRDLVFKRPGAPLADVMVPPIAVTALTGREEVAEVCQRYHLLGVPVTTDDGILLGMVTSEMILEAVQDEASEDFAAAVGAGVGETVYTDVTTSFLMRAPWLVLNLVFALLVALVIDAQTGIITKEPVLAALMPVIALLGGNGGNQSLAVMIRSLATDDVPRAQVPGIMGRQAGVGLLNGVFLAVVAAGLSYLLISTGVLISNSDPPMVALVVAIATAANLLIATVAGVLTPLILRRLRLDPALAASILVTLLTDFVGFGGFLVVASRLL